MINQDRPTPRIYDPMPSSDLKENEEKKKKEEKKKEEKENSVATFDLRES